MMSQYKRMTRSWRFWIFLLLLSLVSALLLAYATAPYGAGLGTDGAIQASTAENLRRGIGFYDYGERPFVRWPPLYPLVLAALSRLSGLDAFTAGWYFNIVLHGGVVFLSGALLAACFEDRLLWAALGSLAVAASASLLRDSACIGTDPLFMCLTLGFLLCAQRCLTAASRVGLLGMGLLACLASLQRLPGVALIAAGALLFLYLKLRDFRTGMRQSLLFATAAFLPLGAWVLVHNWLQNHTWFGVYLLEETRPVENLPHILARILHWFAPYSLTGRLPGLAQAGIVLAVVLSLALISRREDWLRLCRRLTCPPVLASLVFALLYLALLALTINSTDTNYPEYDRYELVVLAPVLIFIFAVLQELVVARFGRWENPARLVLLAAFAIWLVYPISNEVKFIRQARAGEPNLYNRFNTRQMRQSKLVQVIQQLGRDEAMTLYSNYPAAAWFYTRRTALDSPRGTIMENLKLEEVLEANRGWPGGRPGYLVWVLPNEYDHVLEPRDLRRLADLRPIYRGVDGEVYRVSSRSP